MRPIIVGFIVTAALASLAGPSSVSAGTTQLAATFNHANSNRYQHLVCVYAQGGVVHQCPLTITGPQAKAGLPCYCGNSPKGIIKSVPLQNAP
ncbi:MAG: hypothetical protein WDM94_13380 [Bauldia sp.]